MIFASFITEWIGRLLGYENVQSIDRIEPSFSASWAQARTAPAWIFLACAVLCCVAVMFYLRAQTHGRKKVRVALAIGRAALLCLIFLILAEPILVLKLTGSPRPLLWVLFDGTDSMAIEDELSESERAALAKAVGSLEGTGNSPDTGDSTLDPETDKLTRMQYVQALVERSDQNVFRQLEQKFQIKPFLFDRPDGVRSLDASTDPLEKLDPSRTAAQLTTEGKVTALGSALSDLARRHATGNLAGLVIVSDFDQNSGPSPLGPAQKLGVPIYTVGVGPKASVDLRVALQADPKMKKAERKTLDVVLAQEGLEGRAVNVRLTAQSKSQAEGPVEITVIGEKQVTLNQPSVAVQFDYVPSEAGRFALVAEVEPVEGEVVSQNNRAEREVTILDDFLRLMYVEYEPTWEWRFIKEVFHRDKLVGLRGFRTFLRSADPAVRQSNELFLPTMTPKRADFFAHDVIFLGDMPASTLSTRFCELTKEFVSKFGGGLVVLAGPRFGPGELAQTPLADMLPVVVDPDARLRDEREFQLRLAPAAGTVDFMKLGASDAENTKAWLNLGPLPWYQPVARLHPLAASLAEHPSDTCIDGKTPQPLIAIRKYGRGEVVYLGFDETWRMRRRYGELYYRQFWGQMIHRLGLSHALGNQKRFVVQTDRQQYQADDKVVLTVEAYNADFEPLAADKLPERQLVAELLLPGKRSDGGEKIQPLHVPQRREGIFEAQIPVDLAGEHHIRVKDPITGETQEVHFQVTSLSAERRSAVRNVALQQALAAETRGKAYDLTDVASLPDDVQLPRRLETSVKVVPLWNTWLMFVLVLLLMFGEWVARKMVSLP